MSAPAKSTLEMARRDFADDRFRFACYGLARIASFTDSPGEVCFVVLRRVLGVLTRGRLRLVFKGRAYASGDSTGSPTCRFSFRVYLSFPCVGFRCL